MKNEAPPAQPFDEYRKRQGLNWSLLKHMYQSPAAFRYYADNPDADPDTASRGALRAIHAAILEPQVFAKEFGIFHGRRAGQAWEAQIASSPRKTFLNEKESREVLGIAKAVREHPAARQYLAGSVREQSLFWIEGGRPMKGRMDAVKFRRDGVTIVDLKAVPSTRARPTSAQVAKMLYHGQLAHYAAGVSAIWGIPVDHIDAALVVYEQRPPFDVAVYTLGPDDSMYVGQEFRAQLLARLAECEASGRWPSREEQAQPLELPLWAPGIDQEGEEKFDDE